MESKNAESCLETFLVASVHVIDNLGTQIEQLDKKKRKYCSEKKSEVNCEIEKKVAERNRCLGRYSAVVLEMLDAVLENPELLDVKYISRNTKYNGSVIDFVISKKEEVMFICRDNLDEDFDIKTVLNVGLSAHKDGQKEATDEDVAKAISKKNVKKLVKTLV